MKEILRIHPAALAFHPASLTPFPGAHLASWGLIPSKVLAARLFPTGLLPPNVIPAGFSRAAFPAGAFVRLEFAPRGALAFDGAFVPQTFLRIEELGQGRKRQPAEGCAERTEDRGRFHNGFSGSPDSVSHGIWSFNVATRQIVRCRGEKGDADARKPLPT
jgi:hypothetical protein